MTPSTVGLTSLGVGLLVTWLSGRIPVSSIAAMLMAVVPGIGLGLSLVFKGDGC